MKRECFETLCNIVESEIGKDSFKSESYIMELRSLGHANCLATMYHATRHSSGKWLQGEIKTAINLRFLAGASYLDMFTAYRVHPNHF